MPNINPTKLLRTSLLTLGLLGILHSNIQAGEIEQKAFIERFYQNILNRSSDTGGMNTWMNTIQNQSATQVAMGFLNSQELANKNLSNEEYLDILYQTLFDRQADSGGRNDWLEKMRNGRTKQSVMFGFFQSDEFKNLANKFGVTQILSTDNPTLAGVESYVDRFYRLVLKRNYDENGFNDWVNQLTNKTKNPTEIANGFLFSPEYVKQNEDNSTYLDTCYQAFFGRASDEGGKSDWLNKINQGYTRQQIFEGFTGSQEFTNLVNSFNLDNLDNDAPVFTSSTTMGVIENQKVVGKIVATDTSSITYSLTGTDASYFNIDSTTGELTLKQKANYEIKPSYSIIAKAKDLNGNSSSQDITVNLIETFKSGDTFNSLTYNVLISPITGKKWLDRNLGATQVCTSSTDTSCYGDYYQWGRLTDGHEKVSSIITTSLASDISNAGNSFITNNSSTYDWTTVDTDGALRTAQWSKSDGTGICPIGYKVPTINELKSETTDFNGTNDLTTGTVKVINATTAFTNFLKLPTQSMRSGLNGVINQNDLSGYIWSSSIDGDLSQYLYFNANSSLSLRDSRTSAKAIRCVEDFDKSLFDTSNPVFTSANTVDVAENSKDVLTVTATDNSPIKYSLSGTDANSFYITSDTGKITLKTLPDYNTKSSYSIIVTATDSSDNKTTQNVTVNIIKSFQSGDTWKGLVYNVITSPITGKKWLDRNLGATQVCTSSTDSACYGGYYYEVANVCPVGFKVPSLNELNAETINFTGIDNPLTGAIKVTNSATAFQNFLKFPIAGQAALTGFPLEQVSWGKVWAITGGLYFDNNIADNSLYHHYGYYETSPSIRCVEN